MKFIYTCLLLIASLSSIGKNYYVSAKKGDSKYNGLTPSKPKSRIQEAANLTKPGDTVFVMNGTYSNIYTSDDVLDIPKSGTLKKNIVYINYPSHHPIISFSGWAGIAIQNGVSYIKIIGFEVVGNNAKVVLTNALKQPQSCVNRKGNYDSKYNGNGIIINGKIGRHTHHIVIARNKVHDCGGGGIGAAQSDYITFEENIVYNTSLYTIFGTSGISFYQFWNFDYAPGYHNVIRRNKCYNNRSLVPCIKSCEILDGNGIIVDDFRNMQYGSKLGAYKGRTLIENNICWFNGGTGIHAFQSDHIDIVNNTAYCNLKSKEAKSGQILAGGSSDVRIVNNILVTDSLNPINSNFLNTHLTYANNLHYNTTNPTQTEAVIYNSTCIKGLDPFFVLPENSLNANFMLQIKSPAINNGNSILYGHTDFNNNKRPRGKAPDIGAYEY